MRVWFMTCVLLAAVTLFGCGVAASKDTDVTSVRFDRDGALTHTIVEPFNDGDYDVDELKEMISSEIASFKDGEGITLKKAEEKGEDVRVIMTYADSSLFEEFNNEKLFFGTIAGAEGAGYSMRDGNFVNADDAEGSTMGAFDDKEKHIIISALKSMIITPYKVTFMTDGAVRMTDTEVDATGVEDEFVYIILEK